MFKNLAVLKTAIKYAERFLSNYEYAIRWLDDLNYHIDALKEEMEATAKTSIFCIVL